MKRKPLLQGLTACACVLSILLFQACKKNQNLASSKSSVLSRTKSPDWTLGQPIVNGVYKFTNPNSNKVLDLPSNAVFTNGTKLQQYDYYQLNTQSWVITSVGSGYFTIINAVSGKSLDVPGGTATQGLQLQQWDYYALTSQQWAITSVGLGGYKIVNRATGMDVTVDGGSTANGAKITETTDGTSCCSSQIWVPQQVPYKDLTSTAFFQRTSGITSMDGGLDVSLSDGRVLWLFGDSHLDTYTASDKTVLCAFQVRNSGIVQSLNNWAWASSTVLLGTGSTDLFRMNTTAGYYTWNGAAFQANSKVYVYNMNMVHDGTGDHSAGPDKWGEMAFPGLNVTGYSTISYGTPSASKISFGVFGFVKYTDGYVYAYGLKAPGYPTLNTLIVARFPQSNPNAAWNYYTGSGWSTDPATAANIVTLPGIDYGPNVCLVKGKFLITTAQFSLNCDNGTAIYASTSSSPTGGFSAFKTIYNIDDQYQGHVPQFYLAVAHPEYINSNDEILITYNVNGYGSCFPYCNSNRLIADWYRPKAFRMPLSLIDPAL